MLALFDEIVLSSVKKVIVEELQVNEKQPVNRPKIDLWVFSDNSKMPEQFLIINTQVLEYAI